MADRRDTLRPFPKGVSGNPGGRPKGNPAVKALLKENSLEAAKKLVELLNCGLEKVELAAATEILNRTEGKPLQEQDIKIHGSLSMRDQIRAVLREKFKEGEKQTSTEEQENAE